MTFTNSNKKLLDYGENSTFDYIKQCFDNYREYLFSIKEKVSPTVFDFAVADWHYDHEDHRCPHDSWVQSVEINEGKAQEDLRKTIKITINLLGAYHDGKIQISYKEVVYYSLEKLPLTGTQANFFKEPIASHGDWLVDEISLSKDNLVVHDIEFSNNARWTIYCKDIEYKWLPFD